MLLIFFSLGTPIENTLAAFLSGDAYAPGPG